MFFSFDPIIFEDVQKCKQCQNIFLEEAFIRNIPNSNTTTRHYKNKCNGCFAIDNGYGSGEMNSNIKSIDIYNKKVQETASPENFSEQEIKNFTKKLHELYKKLEDSLYPEYRDYSGDIEEGCAGLYTKAEQEHNSYVYSKQCKISRHWAYSYNKPTEKKVDKQEINIEEFEAETIVSVVSETESEIEYKQNTNKYIDRFSSSSYPIADIIKYRKEYEVYLEDLIERNKYYEKKVSTSENMGDIDELYKSIDKVVEKQQEIKRVNSAIKALKKAMLYFM